MMRLKAGLRRRVAVTFAVFATLFVTAETVAIYFVTDGQEEEFIDHVLEDEMRVIIEQHQRGAEIRMPHNDVMNGVIVRNAEEREKLPVHLQRLSVGTHEIFVDGTEFHVAVQQQGQTLFYLLYDATRHEARIEEFLRFLLLLLLASAVAAAVLGFWLSGRLVRQVADLAERVAGLDPNADHPPLAEGYRDEEVVKLAHAFDHYHRRMAQLVKREKEFTANVSHELRTPLTAIKTGCELLTEDSALQGKSRLRLEAIGDAVERITQSMQALLFLAREIPVSDDEPIELREVVEEAFAPFHETLSSKAIEVEIRVPDGASLRIHRPALSLALSNLVRNAVDYTDRGRITVTFERDMLSITDSGCGIPKTDLPHIFKRAYRAGQAQRPDGKGLGLSIVKRIADRFGWRISVTSQLHQGSTFAIIFPPQSLVPSVAIAEPDAARELA